MDGGRQLAVSRRLRLRRKNSAGSGAVGTGCSAGPRAGKIKRAREQKTEAYKPLFFVFGVVALVSA